MRNQTVKHVIRFLAPRILAVALAAFWAVGEAAEAADVQLSRVGATVIEITGGSGKSAWRLRYGTRTVTSYRPEHPQVISAGGDRAWFCHGGWLRLIDTKAGVVVGRWHFPDEIISVVPIGSRAQVEIESVYSDEHVFKKVLEFDPNAPVIPDWPSNILLLYQVAFDEARLAWPEVVITSSSHSYKASPEQAKKLLPEIEEAVRRDPLTPWFRIALGKLMWDVGNPRAAEVFRESVRVPTTDFTELLSISTVLDGVGEHETGRSAFERGYRDYWTRGNDPRLFVWLIGRLFLYGSPFASLTSNTTAEQRRELIERVFQLTPRAQGADLAWSSYADYLQKSGRIEDARLWRERGEEARKESPLHTESTNWMGVDNALLIVMAAVPAFLVYIVALYARYRSQRRLDLAARRQSTGRVRGYAFFNTEYWSRRERVGFFTIVFVAWVSVGVIVQDVQGILRRASAPVTLGMGSFAGPENEWYLQNQLPNSPERELLLAFSYQASGETDKAEGLYRSLPQFAESWNNLGAILKIEGKEQEARQAFERALQLDSGLAEAALNLDRPPVDFWTEQHKKYMPSRPMLAPPRKSHVLGAFLGVSPTQRYVLALLGPFAGQEHSITWIRRLIS